MDGEDKENAGPQGGYPDGTDYQLKNLGYRLNQWEAPEYQQGFQGEMPRSDGFWSSGKKR